MNLPERNDWEVTDDEGVMLTGWAQSSKAAIVEIGSYRGRSTTFLAAGSSAGGAHPVYAVDLWESGPGFASIAPGRMIKRPYAERSTREAFNANAETYGFGLIRAMQGNSVAVAQTFTDPIGMLFVDGSHATRDVVADVRAWAGRVIAGGIIAFHDSEKRQVRAGINATITRQPSVWQKVFDEGRLAAFQRLPVKP